ncbi:VWA domain-containing protein [Oleiharenicola lentus]|uniref:VWA domain-containing protein n=1 Tax=Oleiharenicola lentus TaxID=2508720 RepID=UPI003F678A1C
MRFLIPGWLWLVPVILLAASAAWLWTARDLRRRLALFGESAIRVRTHGAQGQILAATLLLLALTLALARPLGSLSPQAAQRQGVNLLIALDGSRSMLAEDVKPNRFAFAQAGIDDLLQRLSGDRAGLLLFAGQATVVSPLTFDTISLKLINRSLDPEWVGKGGSSLSEVIARASEFFRNRPAQSRVLVIFSDGEETDGDAVIAAQQAFRRDGLRVFTVGVGSPEGAPIPRVERNLRREPVRMGLVRDAQGEEVRTRIEESVLRAIAENAGGVYVNLQQTAGSLEQLVQVSLQPLAAPMEDAPLTDYREWFQLPLALALAGLLGGALWTGAARRRVSANAAMMVVGVLGIFSAPRAQADVTEAQRLIERGDGAGAFAVLQAELLKTPDDLLARYNYALGAYVAGKFTTAAEAFEKLATSAEPEVEVRSRVQWGNSLYRLGLEMQATNPEGASANWEKALDAYRKAAESPLANANYAKTRVDLLSLLNRLATEKMTEGDAAARMSRDKGVPAWREAIRHLDKALKIAESETEATAFARDRLATVDRIYQAYFLGAADKQRRAELQKESALERAIELLGEAVDEYTEAIAVRPNDDAALSAQAAAKALLNPWRVEFGDRLHEEGNQVAAVSLADAISVWGKADQQYGKVLAEVPGDPGALAGQKKNHRALHAGYVALGDQQVTRAREPGLSAEDRDALLEQALGSYQAALAFEPADEATREKLMTVGRDLAGVFVARGQQELADAKTRAEKNIPEAIAGLERAIQSFGKALRFVPDHAEAKLGKKEAEDLLKKLRDLDAREQRKVLGEGKDMKDPKEMEDPGDLALKLLDFDNQQLASKKQQNFTAPENKPVKDW